MTTPTGAIYLSDVNTELGRASNAAINMNDSAVRNLAGQPSGNVNMNQLRGKSAVTLYVQGYDFSAYKPSPVCTCGWYIAADGTIHQNANSSYSQEGTWRTGGVASDYQVMVTEPVNVVGPAFSTWHTLTADFHWYCQNTQQDKGKLGTFVYQIRHINGTVYGSARVNLEAIVGVDA